MIISAIAAMDHTGLIGNDMKMPWHLPLDLRRFREHTLGKPIVMGRRTFDSLRAPLPGRLNIILTHNRSFQAEGCHISRTVEDALKTAEDFAGQTGCDEVMIIGGSAVFEETAPLWDRLLLTVVVGDFRGDTFFPLGRMRELRWRLVHQDYCRPDARNVYAHWFLALERLGMDSLHVPSFDIFAWLKDQSGPVEESSHKYC